MPHTVLAPLRTLSTQAYTACVFAMLGAALCALQPSTLRTVAIAEVATRVVACSWPLVSEVFSVAQASAQPSLPWTSW